MEKPKYDISRYEKKDKTLCKYEFQQTAKDIIKEFGVIKPYDKIIFKWAKKNCLYLKAKASNLRESAEYKGDDIATYGSLLTYLLTKK